MHSKLLAGTAVSALLALSSTAQANTLVGSIIGAYDEQCSAATCISAVNAVSGTSIAHYANNNGGNPAPFDTPNLFILNPNGTAFTNVRVTLTGYQDAAGGGPGSSFTGTASNPATVTIAVPDIAASTVYQLIWGNGNVSQSLTLSGQHGQNLFAYDYDDLLGNQVPGGTGIVGRDVNDPSGHHCGTNDTHNTGICSFVGNFDVAFSATYNGGTISSDFGNIAFGSNAFVCWEGLDPSGLSETFCDIHSNTFPGTLAEIFTGTNQNGGGTIGVPEPGTLALVAGGLGALATARRRRKTKQA